MSEELGLTAKKSENFSEWYTQVIQKAELADYSLVSGCIVFRPYSYSIWERVKEEVDKRIKALGVKNAYFPIFIPESLLSKEAEHVKGFKPEVAWVTIGGDTPLSERLAVRPTSEAIMYDSYSKWIRSWRDLPLKLNQWNNVVRWEFKHPTPFLRTREFLWNEGHTAFATREEAEKEVKDILEVYRVVVEEYLAICGIAGKKTNSEKFAGAEYTCCFEYLMPSGKAVQGPDAHFDGQNFAKAYDIKFLDNAGMENYVWQNTWAITTRMLGVMFAVHGDDKGLVLPPKIAPLQAVIVPILFEKTKNEVLAEASKIQYALEEAGVRSHLDDRDAYSPGFKFNEWELKGVPLRIEIGPRDLKNGEVILVRRDTGEKRNVKLSGLKNAVTIALESIQSNLLSKSKKFLESHITEVKDYAIFKKIVENGNGFAKISWCGDAKCEEKIKEETGATMRVIPFDEKAGPKSRCIYCGKSAKDVVYAARSY